MHTELWAVQLVSSTDFSSVCYSNKNTVVYAISKCYENIWKKTSAEVRTDLTLDDDAKKLSWMIIIIDHLNEQNSQKTITTCSSNGFP